MKSDKDEKIEITRARFTQFVESESELRNLQSEQDESAGWKKFGAFLFYCLTVWGVSIDEGRYAMFLAIMGPAFLYIGNKIPLGAEVFINFLVLSTFIAIISISALTLELDPNVSFEFYFTVFAFSVIGAGFLPLKKSHP